MEDRRFIHQTNIDNSLILMERLIKKLDEKNIQYYLDFGTLLAAIRDKKFIRWDTNINISLLDEKDYHMLPSILKSLREDFKCSTTIKTFKGSSYLKSPFKWYTIPRETTFIGKIKYFFKRVKRKLNRLGFLNATKKFKKNDYRIASIENRDKSVLIEIYFKYKKDNFLYWGAYKKIKRIPVAYVEKGIEKIDFYGQNMSVLKDYDHYLTYLYDNWEVPYKKYHQEDGVSMLDEYRKKTSGDRRFLHKQNLEAMVDLLRIVINVLENHHIEYCLDMGTLLGAMREESLLLWDDDTDLTLINEKDFHKLPMILKEIEKRTGYETNLYTIEDTQIEYSRYIDKYVEPRDIEFTDINNYQLAKIRNRRVYIPNKVNIIMDLFCQYAYQGNNHWFMFGKVYSVPTSLWDNGFKKIDFHGISSNVPVEYDKYLSQWFGEWQVPNEDWQEDDSPAMHSDYKGQIAEDRRFIHTKNTEAMVKLFRVVDVVLKHYDIKYYLDFGTLIGAARNGEFIPWDDDMDISIIDEKDFIKLPMVIHTIEQSFGYFAKCYSFKHSQEVYAASEELYVEPRAIEFTDTENNQVAIIKTNENWIPGQGNAIIDIFCKYNYNEELYWMAFGKEYKMAYAPLEKGFKEIDFYGVKCLIPVAYDEYLSGHYGEWEIPNKTWDQADSAAMSDTYRS